MAKRKRKSCIPNPSLLRGAVLSILSNGGTMSTPEIGNALKNDYPDLVSRLSGSWEPNLATIIRRHLPDLQTVGYPKQGTPRRWKLPKKKTARHPEKGQAAAAAASLLLDLTSPSRRDPPTVSPHPTTTTSAFSYSPDPMANAYISMSLTRIAALEERVRQLEAKLTAVGLYLSK